MNIMIVIRLYKVAETNKKMYTDAIKQIFNENNLNNYTSESGVKASCNNN